MAKSEPPRVFIELQLMDQILPSGDARADQPPPVPLEPKTPIGPPIRVLSFADMSDFEAEWVVTLRDLPAGPVTIETLPGAELSMADLNHLASELDRDLIVRRVG